MTDKQNGGPAFPQGFATVDNNGQPLMPRDVEGGMTLRDWFAGQALTGLVGYSPYGTIVTKQDTELASFSYRMADAMLKERDK